MTARLLIPALTLAALVGCSSTPPAPQGGPQPINRPIPPDTGLLTIFLQPGISSHNAAFSERWLAEIDKIATDENVPVVILDARRGAPENLTATPALVFHNARGRSIYQGRYATTERVRTFLRTARYAPQGDALLTRRDLPVRRIGRATLALPLKFAAVTGTIPPDFDQSAFDQVARDAVRAGFQDFTWHESDLPLRRTDRMFYVDFYPWVAEDGALYLSAKVFSQFHCKKPIWELLGEHNHGLLIDAPKLYRNAARAAEQAVMQALRDSDRGDGLDPLAREIPNVAWSALGLTLPAPAENDTAFTAHAADLELTRAWQVLPAQNDDPPQVRFRFMPPLDLYTGEVRTVRGDLTLAEDRSASDLAARFIADLTTLTMGEPDLDEALQSPIFLATDLHPTSAFVVDSTDAPADPLAFGDSVGLTMNGRLTLKGQSVPLTARAQLEPIVSAAGEPRLRLTASFELDTRPWDLEGPDGPAPAKHMMQFDVDLLLEPAADSSAAAP